MGAPPRVFLPALPGPGIATVEGDLAKRLSSVLRMKPGDALRVFSGDGREYDAAFAGAEGRRAVIRVGAVCRQEPPSPLQLELCCGLVRANRFDAVVEKATEAGADVIVPLLTEYSTRRDEPSPARYERWERIAIEAAEQCGRLYVPLLESPARFDTAIARSGGASLLCHPGDEAWPHAAALLPSRGRLAIFIGPEGGFSDAEVATARRAGAVVAAIAPNLLRTETAAMVATALVRAATLD
jgi:16S rRNA (uracil1498-N3)-methyltransferase